MGEAYPPCDGDGQEPVEKDLRFKAAPEDELIRLEEFRQAHERARVQMESIPVQAPPAEPYLRTGDPS